MGNSGSVADGRLRPVAPLQLRDDDLALFVLNVGDGDALVVRFPIIVPGDPPTYGVIDSFDADKTIALINDLGAGPIRFVCATHPHFDHIRGLRDVLRTFRNSVAEFWDSGFRYTSATYLRLLEEVETQAPGIRFIRPTSGFEFMHARAQVTVLSPSIALRNRYDTYGVDVNNASIVARVRYPVPAPSVQYPGSKSPAAGKPVTTRTIILGGDAQTDAWGQVIQEFPHLDLDPKNWVRQIGGGTGSQPLACDLFKVSHHSSKRGVNLELLERMGDRTGKGPSDGPRWLVVSCASGADSDYGFPHSVTQALMREVRNPQAQAGGQHKPDDELGIHFTSQTLASDGSPLGSIAFVIGGDGRTSLYRFRDRVTEPVDLSSARRSR